MIKYHNLLSLFLGGQYFSFIADDDLKACTCPEPREKSRLFLFLFFSPFLPLIESD